MGYIFFFLSLYTMWNEALGGIVGYDESSTICRKVIGFRVLGANILYRGLLVQLV